MLRGLYQHYLEEGKTINLEYYIEVLCKFLMHLCGKRPNLMAKGWFFHQDNACPHVSAATSEYMARRKIQLLPHAPYLPDLAPCDFHLFPKLKTHLAVKKFDTLQEVKMAV